MRFSLFRLRALALACSVVAACGLASSEARGAAALAAGCLTSVKPTAINAQQRAMQIAADPAGILDFQFTIQFDPTQVYIDSIPVNFGGVVLQAPKIYTINGYKLGLRDSPEELGYEIYTSGNIGYVTVRGYWDLGTGPLPTEELNVFEVGFKLRQELPLNTLVTFNALGIGGGRTFGNDDFMKARYTDFPTDDGPFTGDVTYGPDKIVPSQVSFRLVPLPSAAMGALVLSVPLLIGRRREAIGTGGGAC